jgi:hypothetical protein
MKILIANRTFLLLFAANNICRLIYHCHKLVDLIDKEDERKYLIILFKKPEGERVSLERPMHGWNNNTDLNKQNMGIVCVPEIVTLLFFHFKN